MWCGKSVEVFHCVGVPSAYIPIFFTNLNWNKCWFIPIFCHRCGKHLDVTITVRLCCCGLYFEGTSPKILNSIFDLQSQMELCHFLNRLSFQGSFSPELCFIRCSKDASSKNRVKECSMGCNVGFPKNNIHLLSRSCTFAPFSEASLEIQALFYSYFD